ncbi:uncharacterized protein LOC118264489 [Spodoptera frugiperda]|uniref:Uncharacterized protein LOC118264489 n=1 Tax=Spodoptera frugiperda TaxID=7108 RepID=A0A9R0E972_SPOFR|nr:uncharacterized protein LOC118264489 [Spodoptera frugiperda]
MKKMRNKVLRVAQSAITLVMIGMQMLNVEAQHQNDSIVFFDEMDLVTISQRTIDQMELLESLVRLMNKGDRPVRRYFDSYSTPFAGFEEITFNNKPVLRLHE